MEVEARLYRPDGADSQLVRVTCDGARLFVGDDLWLALDDLQLEVGGNTEDRIKVRCPSKGYMLVSEDRRFLDLLAMAQPRTVLGRAVGKARKSLDTRGAKNATYWTVVLAVAIAIPVLIYCAVDYSAGYLVDKIDPKVEGQIGRALLGKTDTYKSSPMQKRVQSIGKRLVAGLSNSPYSFDFYVKTDPTINACAYPGGVIMVNSALVEKADDDELAGVMGHEMGHVLHRDTLHAVAHSAGFLACMGLLVTTGFQNVDQIITGLDLAQRLDSLKYGRAQESAADNTGVRLAVQADYKGDGLLKFFQRLEKVPGAADNPALAMLSTHPMSKERVKAIEAELKELNSKAKDNHRL